MPQGSKKFIFEGTLPTILLLYQFDVTNWDSGIWIELMEDHMTKVHFPKFDFTFSCQSEIGMTILYI